MGEALKLSFPKPQLLAAIDGHFNMRFGPEVIDQSTVALESIGRVISNTSECERMLESLLLSLVPQFHRELGVLLREYRGQSKLTMAIAEILRTTKRLECSETFLSLEPFLEDAFRFRNKLAHGIFACLTRDGRSSLLLWSSKAIAAYQQYVSQSLADFDTMLPEKNMNSYNCEIWTDQDFLSVAAATKGLVNSLYGFSVCIARDPVEASWLHDRLRSQGLLSDPPWNLQNQTPAQ